MKTCFYVIYSSSNSALVEVEGLAGGSSGVLRPVTDGHGVVPDSPKLALELQGLAVHALVVLKQNKHFLRMCS